MGSLAVLMPWRPTCWQVCSRRYEGTSGEEAGGDRVPHCSQSEQWCPWTPHPPGPMPLGCQQAEKPSEHSTLCPAGPSWNKPVASPQRTAGYTMLETGPFFTQTENLSKRSKVLDPTSFLLLLLLALSLGGPYIK